MLALPPVHAREAVMTTSLFHLHHYFHPLIKFCFYFWQKDFSPGQSRPVRAGNLQLPGQPARRRTGFAKRKKTHPQQQPIIDPFRLQARKREKEKLDTPWLRDNNIVTLLWMLLMPVAKKATALVSSNR
jgi:hypothetical protein